MSQQACFKSNRFNDDHFAWPVYRNRRGWPRWYQRILEAWWALTGRYTLWHAYHAGMNTGARNEYHRTVVMGGR